MSTPTLLKTVSRKHTGSQASRQDRAAKRVPVIVYGHGRPNVSACIDEHELSLALHTTAQVFMLSIGGKEESCLVKEVQYDTFGQEILHVDFARIDLSEQVEVEVALEILGTAKGTLAGGVQVVHHPALPVRCRADSIPESIAVDVSALEIGQAVHAGEISLPAGVLLDEHELAAGEPVVGVMAPRVEAEPVEEVPEGETPEGETPAGEEGEKRAEDVEGKDRDKDKKDKKGSDRDKGES